MSDTRQLPSKEWIRNLPYSHIKYPDTFFNRAKYILWRIITPFHPYVREFLTATGIVRPPPRQPFLLGSLAPSQTIEEFVLYLISCGYGNHFVAWKDVGQLISLRRVFDFKYQNHIRIFEDGDVSGHYEYTPEYHPLLHVQDIGLEERREEFLELFGDRVIPASV